jgi:hypothetical protein
MTSSLQQEIFDWVQTLPPWQQDLARRLAVSDRLTAEEIEEVLELILDDAPAVGTNGSAIVLDDPVTSLDQARREYVAQRLAGESRDRQVIVFTNDLAFLRLLQSQARSEGVSCHGQTLLRAGEEVGIVNGEIEPELPGRHRPELHSVPNIAARRGSRLDAVTSGIREMVELS